MQWYRVELHTHTIASDGVMDAEELVKRAKKRNYNAIVVTDHNTTTSCKTAQEKGKKEGLVVVPGIEWTTFWGHIVISGGKSNVDWRSVNLENIDDKLAQARKCGDLVTIAHPKRPGTPFCSECRFLYKLNNWDNVDAYEVWSHYEPSLSEDSTLAKKEWASLINEGHKIAPVYGYDWHAPDEDGPAYAHTYVGMDGELNPENILQAIRDRHTYISMGVNIDAKIIQDGNEYYFGDELAKGNANICLKAHVSSDYLKKFNVEIKGLRIYKNGKMFLAKKWEGEEIDIPIELNCKNVRIELYGAVEGKDCDIAILSPIYITR